MHTRSERTESAGAPGVSPSRVRSLEWTGEGLCLIDQRVLPAAFETVECRTVEEVADAIRTMVVRGAPAIGATAAFGMVLAARELVGGGRAEFMAGLQSAAELLRDSRPTAVNLAWAVNRLQAVAVRHQDLDPEALTRRLLQEAEAIAAADAQTCQDIGRHGAALIPQGAGVLTHCNTGALATVDYGTALGVIRAAHTGQKDIHVYASETRPFLQGARLTTWELLAEGIPATLITDNAAGYLLSTGRVHAVIVGADRITANGDVINKIGTYPLAVLAREHAVPFYCAAPLSTVDPATPCGDAVTIEERAAEEVTHLAGRRIAPEGVAVFNPAFDVTPARLVSAIITEVGVLRPPYQEALAKGGQRYG